MEPCKASTVVAPNNLPWTEPPMATSARPRVRAISNSNSNSNSTYEFLRQIFRYFTSLTKLEKMTVKNKRMSGIKDVVPKSTTLLALLVLATGIIGVVFALPIAAIAQAGLTVVEFTIGDCIFSPQCRCRNMIMLVESGLRTCTIYYDCYCYVSIMINLLNCRIRQ